MLTTEESNQKMIFPVQGMSCMGCANSVEKCLRNEEGVKEAQVNFSDHTVELVFDSKRTNAGQLQKSLRTMGFDLIIEEDEKPQQ